MLETPKEQLHYVSPPMPLPGTSPPPETSMPCTDFEITLFCETPGEFSWIVVALVCIACWSVLARG